MVVIGIDLGTTKCCVAVVQNGKAGVLTNKESKRTTPSIIGFKNDKILIGQIAKDDSHRNPENTIYNVKRLIGLKPNDKTAAKIIENLQFRVATKDKKLNISIDKRNYLAEQLSGHLLRYLKIGAEKSLNCGITDAVITDAVITVPSYFNDSQRRSTVDAGKIAGFKNVNLLNESAAAAIHYGIDNEIHDRTILVFDFGGGKFDISIIKYSKNTTEVLLVDGDISLGGEDIDNKLVQYIIKEFNIKIGKNAKNHKQNMARLKKAAEEAKIELSSKDEVEINWLNFTTEEIIITRNKFNEIIEDIIEKIMKIVERCINHERLANVKIDDILLVGGSTRMPIIKERLEKFKINIKRNTNADEAVALGAAIYAAKIFDDQFGQLKIINICQHSLGVEVDGGKMSVLIPKFSKLPATKTKRYRTANAQQDTIDVNIFSGDDTYTKNNLCLGNFRVSNIKSGPNGTILKETFKVDINGILNVTAINEADHSQPIILQFL